MRPSSRLPAKRFPAPCRSLSIGTARTVVASLVQVLHIAQRTAGQQGHIRGGHAGEGRREGRPTEREEYENVDDSSGRQESSKPPGGVLEDSHAFSGTPQPRRSTPATFPQMAAPYVHPVCHSLWVLLATSLPVLVSSTITPRLTSGSTSILLRSVESGCETSA